MIGRPVRGPVIGMLMLLTDLLVRGSSPEDLATTSDGLLRRLSLLFVPAGVGVIAHLDVMRELETVRKLVISASFRVLASIIGGAGLVVGVVEFEQSTEWASVLLLAPRRYAL